jgi:hypothetical protein
MQGASVLDKHRQVLGILYVVFGALLALGAVVVLAMFVFDAQSSSEEERASALRGSGAVAAFLLLLALPGLIGGIGLLRRRAWSKVLTLVGAVLNLFSFPIGTALGVYAIWFWLQPNTRRLFFP